MTAAWLLLPLTLTLGHAGADGPVAHWDFDGGLVNVPGGQHPAGSQLEPREGGFALVLDRLRRGPVLPRSREWAFDSSETFSISLLIRTEQAGFACLLMAKDLPGGEVSYSFILNRQPGRVSFELWSWQTVRLVSTTTVNDGKWHSLVGAYSASSNRAYLVVDGRVEAMAGVGHGGPAECELRIGDNVDAEQPFEGAVDEIRIESTLAPDAQAAEQAISELAVFAPGEAVATYTRYLSRISRPRNWRPGSLLQWEERKAEIRRQVLEDLGLVPLPERIPLNVHRAGKLVREGYTVERIYWQTWPGYYAAGRLYMPINAQFPAPAILNPHGHWENGNRNPVVQARLIALALKGYVCLTIDSVHYYDYWAGITPQTIMTWNNIRALDLLATMPEVDPLRIGSTGCSGGAQQTFYLMAVEERLSAAVPVCMVSKFSTIIAPDVAHCACNHVPGIAEDMDCPEMAAAFAPRPAFIISVTGDWTKDFPADDLPDLRHVYALYGADKALGASHHDCGHDYNLAMREEAYAFFNYWLRNTADPDEAREPTHEPETAETLAALDDPPVAALGPEAVSAEFRARRGPKLPPPNAPSEARERAAEVRNRVEAILRLRYMPAIEPAPVTVGEVSLHGWRGEKLSYASEADVRVPAVLLHPNESHAPSAAAVVCHPLGKAAALDEPRVRAMLEGGTRVLLVDPRFYGEWEVDRQTATLNGVILGRPPGALGTHDLLQAVRLLQSRPDVDPAAVNLFGFGDTGVLALLAALLDESVASLTALDLGPTYAAGRGEPVCPHLIFAGDLPDFVSCLAPRSVTLTGVGSVADYSAAQHSYELLAAGELLTVTGP